MRQQAQRRATVGSLLPDGDGKYVTNPKNPTKNNYVFNGWYTDEACTQLFDRNQSIKADVRRMQQRSGSARATDEMCRLIVLNTASIQLLPTTVAAVRAANGAAAPFDILPAVWLTSVCSVTDGLLAALLFGRICRA